MFPSPATVRWSSSAALIGARRPCEPLPRAGARERAAERLDAEPFVEVGLELSGLEQLPRAEAAHVAVGDVRSVV